MYSLASMVPRKVSQAYQSTLLISDWSTKRDMMCVHLTGVGNSLGLSTYQPRIKANPFGAQQANPFDLRVVRVDQAVAFKRHDQIRNLEQQTAVFVQPLRAVIAGQALRVGAWCVAHQLEEMLERQPRCFCVTPRVQSRCVLRTGLSRCEPAPRAWRGWGSARRSTCWKFALSSGLKEIKGLRPALFFVDNPIPGLHRLRSQVGQLERFSDRSSGVD